MADLNTRIIISAVDKASGIFNTLQENAGKIAAAIIGYFSVDFFKGAVDSAANFEAQLDKVAAKGGYTADEMAKLTAAAFEIGNKFGVSGTQAGAGLEILAAAGLKASDAINTLPSVLALAKSENVSMDAAATVLTDTISIMGLSFNDAARAADVLTKGANLSNTSAMEMGVALKYTGGAAKAAGMSIEEISAAIDVMAQYGIRGEMAGTGLRNVFAQLQSPSKELSDALGKLGIKSNNLSAVLDGLKAAGSNAGAAMQAFGLVAGPAIYALSDAGTESLRKFTAELYKSSGAAKETSETIQSNFLGAKDRLVAVFDNLKNAVGTPILTPLTTAFDKLKDQLNLFIATGTADKVGQSLGKAFETAGKWAVDFVSKVDFEKVGEDIRAFSDKAVLSLNEIGKQASMAGDGLTIFFNVGKAGFNVIQSAIGAFGSSAAVVFGAINTATGTIITGWGEIFKLVPGFESVGESISAMGDYFKKSGEASNAFAQELARGAVNDMNEAGVSAEKVQTAFKNLTTGAVELTPKLTGIATETDKIKLANEAAAVAVNKLTENTKLSATDRLKVLSEAYDAEVLKHKTGSDERQKLDNEYLASVKLVNQQILLETQKSIDEGVVKQKVANDARIKLQMELDGSLKKTIRGINEIEQAFMTDAEKRAARKKEIEKSQSDYRRAMADGDFKKASEISKATEQLVIDEAKTNAAQVKQKGKDTEEAIRSKRLYNQTIDETKKALESLQVQNKTQSAEQQASLDEQKKKLDSVNESIKTIDGSLSTEKKLTIIAETIAAEKKVEELKQPTQSTHFVLSDISAPVKDISILKGETKSGHTIYSDATVAKAEIAKLKEKTDSTHSITPESKKADDEIKTLEKETESTHKIDPVTGDIDAKIAEIKKPTESTHKVNKDSAEVDNEIDYIKQNTESTHTIHVRTVQDNANGGQIQAFKNGGTPNFQRREGGLGGFGGGDTVPAMLEPGEWIIKKESVQKYGNGFMAKLNAGQIQDVPKFATGGQVSLKDKPHKSLEEQKLSDLTDILSSGGDFEPNFYNNAVSEIKRLRELLKLDDKNEPLPLSDAEKEWANTHAGKPKPVFKATGGHIQGAGTGTSDEIPAMLSNGEYVVKADAVDKVGVDTLDKINNGEKPQGFATGGIVGDLESKINQKQLLLAQKEKELFNQYTEHADTKKLTFEEYKSVVPKYGSDDVKKIAQESYYLKNDLQKLQASYDIEKNIESAQAAIDAPRIQANKEVADKAAQDKAQQDSEQLLAQQATSNAPVNHSTPSVSQNTPTNSTPSSSNEIIIKFQSPSGQEVQGKFAHADVANVINILKEAASRGMPPHI